MNHLLAHLCRNLRHSKLIWFQENLVEEIFGLLIIAGFPHYRDTQSLLPGEFIISEFAYYRDTHSLLPGWFIITEIALLPWYAIVIAGLAFIIAEMFSHYRIRVFEFYPMIREATGGDFIIFTVYGWYLFFPPFHRLSFLSETSKWKARSSC